MGTVLLCPGSQLIATKHSNTAEPEHMGTVLLCPGSQQAQQHNRTVPMCLHREGCKEHRGTVLLCPSSQQAQQHSRTVPVCLHRDAAIQMRNTTLVKQGDGSLVLSQPTSTATQQNRPHVFIARQGGKAHVMQSETRDVSRCIYPNSSKNRYSRTVPMCYA